jgi:hypothetical protein
MKDNLSVPIWLPDDFLTFATEMMKKVSEETPDLPFNQCFKVLIETSTWPEDHILVDFNLSPVTMFQQIDRRVDE